MTRIYYDTEFFEDGRTIDLISIGMVTEDGRELYAVNRDMPVRRIRKHPWLMKNVVPSLPHGFGDRRNTIPRRWLYDYGDASVYTRRQIARKVQRFIQQVPSPELWAWYGAYDHVALCQLWGAMVDLPEGVPMWTHDLMQEVERAGNPQVPRLSRTSAAMAEHNALHDAREVKYRHEWLMERAR